MTKYVLPNKYDEWQKCQGMISQHGLPPSPDHLPGFSVRYGLDLVILRHVFLIYTLPVLSVKQPWASAIIQSGKDCENRTWKVDYRGNLLIHASKQPDPEGDVFISEIGTEIPNTQKLGGIIGCVHLDRIVKGHSSPWAQPGQYHWILSNPRILPFLPIAGQQGLWKVPIDPPLVPEFP